MKQMGVYDQLKKMFQDIIAPELHALRADIQRVETSLGVKIDGVDAKLSSFRAETLSMKGELLAEIRRLDTRIDSVEVRIGGMETRIDRVDARIDGLDRHLQIAIDVRERLAALEARRPA
jgi:hypothetical protein